MSATPEAFFANLLDALERHSQTVQRNTAAINSLLVFARGLAPGDQIGRAAVAGQLAALDAAVVAQLETAKTITDRLELLRRSLTEETVSESTTGPNTTA